MKTCQDNLCQYISNIYYYYESVDGVCNDITTGRIIYPFGGHSSAVWAFVIKSLGWVTVVTYTARPVCWCEWISWQLL